MAEKYSFIVVKYPKPNTGEAALAAVLGLAKSQEEVIYEQSTARVGIDRIPR